MGMRKRKRAINIKTFRRGLHYLFILAHMRCTENAILFGNTVYK